MNEKYLNPITPEGKMISEMCLSQNHDVFRVGAIKFILITYLFMRYFNPEHGFFTLKMFFFLK